MQFYDFSHRIFLNFLEKKIFNREISTAKPKPTSLKEIILFLVLF